MRIFGLFRTAPHSCSSLLLAIGQAPEWGTGFARVFRQLAISSLPALAFVVSTREEVYNVLWALVFGFATLNILSLGARRFEQKSGLNFGEVLAILVVIVSIVLVSWEMLYVFHVLPIRLTAR
jgi:hypothetical protein